MGPMGTDRLSGVNSHILNRSEPRDHQSAIPAPSQGSPNPLWGRGTTQLRCDDAKTSTFTLASCRDSLRPVRGRLTMAGAFWTLLLASVYLPVLSFFPVVTLWGRVHSPPQPGRVFSLPPSSPANRERGPAEKPFREAE